MADALRVGDAIALAGAVLLRLAWLAAELAAAGALSIGIVEQESKNRSS